jgi:hypothetical protein
LPLQLEQRTRGAERSIADTELSEFLAGSNRIERGSGTDSEREFHSRCRNRALELAPDHERLLQASSSIGLHGGP